MDLPEPLVSAEIDVRDLDGFMLNVERLLASELWALSTPEEFKAAMALWCRAWKQLPGGSLPNDERVLAAFAGVGSRWRKVREMALRGFILCSDGRLYHKVLCEDVVRAFTKKTERRERTKAATEARQRQRDEQRDEQRDVPPKPPRNVVPETGQGQDRDEKEEERTDAIASARANGTANGVVANGRAKPRRGFPADWLPDEHDCDFARAEGRDDGWIEREGPHCRDFHIGKGNLFADHKAAWRTWVRNAAEFDHPAGPGAQRPGSGGSSGSRIAAALGKVHLGPGFPRAD